MDIAFLLIIPVQIWYNKQIIFLFEGIRNIIFFFFSIFIFEKMENLYKLFFIIWGFARSIVLFVVPVIY